MSKAKPNADHLKDCVPRGRGGRSFRTSITALRATEEIDDTPRLSERIRCVRMAFDGIPLVQLSQLFNRHPRTIERWLRRFRESGVDGLRDKFRSGRRPRLRPEDLAAVARDVKRLPIRVGYRAKKHWDGPLLAAHLRVHFQVILSVRQCQRLLHTLLEPVAVPLIRAA